MHGGRAVHDSPLACSDSQQRSREEGTRKHLCVESSAFMSASSASSSSEAAVRPATLRAWYALTTRFQSPVASLLSTCQHQSCDSTIGERSSMREAAAGHMKQLDAWCRHG